MTEVTFYLSDEMMDRLWAAKDQEGRKDLTGNEYARELMERMLYQLHPATVSHDDCD